MHGSFCFTYQLRVVVLVDPLFLTISLSGLIDLCHLRLCIQDLLQLVMVGRAVLIRQPKKGLLCHFILRLLSSLNGTEKYERVEVVLSLILLLRIKQFVVWKTWLLELGILPFSVVSTSPRVVGHQVVETDVFQTLQSLMIVCVH